MYIMMYILFFDTKYVVASAMTSINMVHSYVCTLTAYTVHH